MYIVGGPWNHKLCIHLDYSSTDILKCLQHVEPRGSVSMVIYTRKFNIAPEKWWLEDDPVLLGPGNFSGPSC